MATIIGLDLEKCKGPAGLDDPATTGARSTAIHTDPADPRKYP